MQRLLDIILAGIALILLSPFLLPLVIALRFSGEGDVFYRQERVGRHGKSFSLLKFATMLRNSPNIGTGEITVHNDPRILPLGHFLRKTKINEIPQIWNVIIGDMSIVGPRPMVPDTFKRYPDEFKLALCSVRPGLTGIGSIIFRDEEKFLACCVDPVSFYRSSIIPYKCELEVWYVKHKSLLLYLKVVVATAIVIVFPRSTLPYRTFRGLPSLPAELVAPMEPS
jgi:lipopolysaccharide/colanic/teichoic acid biosynthesis glycosyltransferase